MNSSTDDYWYEHAGATIRVAVHCGGASREPRIRWQVGDQDGEYGYVRLTTSKPVVRLENGETVQLAGQSVSAIPVPREIGEQLADECERRGRVVPGGDQITTDPSAFPVEIAGFDRVGWEANRSVMWYSSGDRTTPRAYQIEGGELVFRAQEWANGRISEQELIDRYGLAVTF
jgi:hypothetical protein